MKQLVLISLLCIYLVSCNDGPDKTLLLGNWLSMEWKEVKSNQNINASMNMNFQDDGNYLIDYGSVTEKGEWWVRGHFLHTREHDELEKKVKIAHVNSDTLILEMNRSGVLEEVMLLRENN